MENETIGLETIGQKLQHLRLNENLSQTEVANKTGISRKSLSSIENGNNFSIAILIKLLGLYGRLQDFKNIISLPGNFNIIKFKKELSEMRRKGILK